MRKQDLKKESGPESWQLGSAQGCDYLKLGSGYSKGQCFCSDSYG